MKTHPRTGWVHLQVKGRYLDRLLLFSGQFGKAVGEGVGYSEIHRITFVVW